MAKIVERVEGVRGDMQVTLEFDVYLEMRIDRVLLKSMVVTHLLPLIDQGVRQGQHEFLDVPYEWVSIGGEVINSGKARLVVIWTAHRPWWAEDNHDWDKVPLQSRPLPDSTHIT